MHKGHKPIETAYYYVCQDNIILRYMLRAWSFRTQCKTFEVEHRRLYPLLAMCRVILLDNYPKQDKRFETITHGTVVF